MSEMRMIESNPSNKEQLEYEIICILGRPGSGKGKQTEELKKNNKIIINGVEKDEIFSISTGGICRAEEHDTDSPYSKQIIDWNNKGILFPDDFILHMTYDHITKKVQSGEFDPTIQKLLIDGYNRTPNQVKIMEGYFKVKATILLDVPMYVGLLRTSERQKIEPRRENSTARKRFNRQMDYEKYISDIITILPKETFHIVNGNRSITEVYRDISAILKT